MPTRPYPPWPLFKCSVVAAFGCSLTITPSPVSLALSIAIRAAKEAHATKAAIGWKQTGASGSPKWVDKENLPRLFSYFEQSMVAATFSFQSLEAYANQLLVQSLEGKMKLTRFKGDVEWDAAEIERNCSTEEKLATILPAIGKTKSPKGTKVWETFVRLKAIRDGTIHLKELNQYVRGTEDTQTLYYEFLAHDPREYPRRAIAMMRHFSGVGFDSWLIPAEELLEA